MRQMADPTPSHTDSAGDGTVERILKRTSRASAAAIFIHAGAGYHSQANERIHLEACNDAARIGMRFLRNGADATEAVEAAVRSLEDKEITNAGYGSNLNMDGVVECDATLVDHMGRSGACGAVPGIKNPISLAKLILDTSSQPLSLRRVPPNILVGAGAQTFAEEHLMETVPNELLVSRGAKDRYMRWATDLKKAEERLDPSDTSCGYPDTEGRPGTPEEYDKAATPSSTDRRRDHSNAILTGTWNEGQPDSPFDPASPAAPTSPPVVGLTPISVLSPQHGSPCLTPTGSKPVDRTPLGFVHALQSRSSSSPKRAKLHYGQGADPAGVSSSRSTLPHDGSPSAAAYSHLSGTPSQVGGASPSDPIVLEDTMIPGEDWAHQDQDMVTDTVGAIAIDLHGHIAAASSSGGIGMKHQGRIGPAALVGIGTTVIPEDPSDPDSVSVAAVTSGTGEHMATTMAAGKCAERLFHNTRRGPGGQNAEEWDETAVMESFITDDFMNHPGVKNQSWAGAIGVMAVKKARTGVYFYFAHNTDSFALASMSSRDHEPLCVMSRLGDRRDISQGARKMASD